jgi:deferrochelatase/peroxidase EfeB
VSLPEEGVGADLGTIKSGIFTPHPTFYFFSFLNKKKHEDLKKVNTGKRR